MKPRVHIPNGNIHNLKVTDFRLDPEPIPLEQAEAEFKAKVDREIQRMTSDAAKLNSGETPADHTGENTA